MAAKPVSVLSLRMATRLNSSAKLARPLANACQAWITNAGSWGWPTRDRP